MPSFNPQSVFDEVSRAPLPGLSVQSRAFLRSDPESWTSSRKRQLRAALENADEEQFKFVLMEYAAVVGLPKAIRVVMRLLEHEIGME